MKYVQTAFDIFISGERHFGVITQNSRVWTFKLLFVIIFMEMGFLLTPILHGDLFLFATGAFRALDLLNITLLSGAFLWMGLFLFAGYFSGNIPETRHTLRQIATAIIPISIMMVKVGRSHNQKCLVNREGAL